MYVYPSSPSAAAADAWGNEHWISDDDHVDIGEGRKEGRKRLLRRHRALTPMDNSRARSLARLSPHAALTSLHSAEEEDGRQTARQRVLMPRTKLSPLYSFMRARKKSSLDGEEKSKMGRVFGSHLVLRGTSSPCTQFSSYIIKFLMHPTNPLLLLQTNKKNAQRPDFVSKSQLMRINQNEHSNAKRCSFPINLSHSHHH